MWLPGLAFVKGALQKMLQTSLEGLSVSDELDAGDLISEGTSRGCPVPPQDEQAVGI